MLARVESSAVLGIEAFKVQVEVDISTGLPSFSIVGLPDTAVQEAKERVRSGVANSEFEFPLRRITVNLAPADVRKEGPVFDLPIAVGVLVATRQVPSDKISDYFIIGELSLTGEVRGVDGVLPAALAAKKEGKKGVIVPRENGSEAALVEEIEVIPAVSLRQVANFLQGKLVVEPVRRDLKTIFAKGRNSKLDFTDVKGQEHAKRALKVAAAGGHNVLLIGPPGSGKTMLAHRLPSILPNLTLSESIEVTRIYSIAGLLSKKTALVSTRPFRSPHHTISSVGLAGGGQIPKPGEISLSHCGILFLDEFPEFTHSALEVLRQPLENGEVTISRALTSLTYPAKFTLIAAMNPCPCGYLGDKAKTCICSPSAIRRYRKRISGPLLDRIDLHIEVPRLTKEELVHSKPAESSKEIRKRAQIARRRQQTRFNGEGIGCNSQLTPSLLKKFCPLSREAIHFLETVIEKLALSARSYDRLLKVARTIADLDEREVIELPDISEAVQYRSLDRSLMV